MKLAVSRTEPVSAKLPAFAKLNLGLRILYKRTDGFHELRTVFQTISLADRIEVTFKRGRKTSVHIEGTPEIADNLVERAAFIVLEALSIHGEARFKLKKHIPQGAGLGGGSSDAATVLLGLPVLAGKALPMDRLQLLAAQLGSDVPFFLHGGAALGLGRGEELYPLPDVPAARGLLVVSGIHSSTAEAYRDLSPRLTSIPLPHKLSNFQHKVWRVCAGGGPGVLSNNLAMDDNDFEAVVFDRYPELSGIKEKLQRFGARPAAMTGSGSAIFGIFSKQSQLERAAKSFSDGTALPISFVSRAQYRSAWRRALKLHVKGTLWPPQSPYARSLSEQ
ncbi:MAG: 4-(cytidine 5'-diphospho)-2-C-methyl-D-erythritol kinase [Acidobacteriota bacterium]|nr:4-(cytidine 5'-diphospho)-2-C-methyl-D-erythritol kinase [Acidobacteriota bacterium]